MGSISVTYDTPLDLTLVTATGKMTAADFHEHLVNYYAGKVTPRILWDLTKADLAGLSTDQVKGLAQRTRQISDVRKGGKTALVFEKALEYGIGRMFEAYAEIEDMPFEFKAFQNLEDAKEWLGL